MEKPNKNTYKRIYYLHRVIKAHGFGLVISETTKTITVPPALAAKAKANKTVTELRDKHQYGVQYLIR